MKEAKDQILDWLGRICATERPSNEIVAYYIGIFEIENGYGLHFAGSNTYDAVDSDWACNDSFVPSERYLDVPALYGLDWFEAQTAIVDAVTFFLSTPIGERAFISNARSVAVGFDDGDLVVVK